MNNLCQASDQDWWEGPWEVDTGRTAGQGGGRAGGRARSRLENLNSSSQH